MTARRLQLLAWGVLWGVAMVAIYLLMVRTSIGQRLDFSSFEGRKWTPLPTRRRIATGVRWGTPVVLLATTAWSSVAAWRERRWALGILVLAGAPTAIFCARFLKAGLPREQLLPASWVGESNGFPSGHTASVLTVSLLAVVVAPVALRVRVTVLAATLAVGHTVAMSSTGWHRPSDLFGGVALAVVLVAPIAWASSGSPRRSVVGSPATDPSARLPTGVLARPDWISVVALVLGCAAASWMAALRLMGAPNLGSYRLHAVLYLASSGAAAAAVLGQSALMQRARVPASGSGPAGRGSVGGAEREDRVQHGA
jgi:hypothetical protein